MLLQESASPPPCPVSFRSGILAVGILWILAIWSAGAKVEIDTLDLEQSGLVSTQDIRLHASGDYSLGIKRFYSRQYDQSSTLKLSDPFWALHSSAIIHVLPISFRARQTLYDYLPVNSLHQLQALNTPRAPPLV